MSIPAIAPTDDVYAERWRQWELANAQSSRKTAAHARIVFAAIFIAAAASLGVLLSLQPWA
jgi:hypothetical protein